MLENFNHACRGYFDWFSLLLTPPEVGEINTEDMGNSTIENLEAELNGYNMVADELIQATNPYVTGEEPHIDRSAAIDSFLNQIEGDLKVANFTWSIMQRVEGLGDDLDQLFIFLVQDIKDSQLFSTYRRLRLEMPANFQEIANIYYTDQSLLPAYHAPTTEAALDNLRFEIEQTIRIIRQRTSSIGSRLTRHILLDADEHWDTILKGIDILRGNQKIADVGWGLEDEVRVENSGLAAELREMLIHILQRLLTIIEKNDVVRYIIADWLEDLKDTPVSQRQQKLETLIEQLYQIDKFRNKQLESWLTDALNVETIAQASLSVMQLGNNFDRMSDQIKQLAIILTTSDLFNHPMLRSTGYALQIGLLGTLIFAGFDHIDEGSNTLNITQGIKEVLIKTLPVSPETLLTSQLQKSMN